MCTIVKPTRDQRRDQRHRDCNFPNLPHGGARGGPGTTARPIPSAANFFDDAVRRHGLARHGGRSNAGLQSLQRGMHLTGALVADVGRFFQAAEDNIAETWQNTRGKWGGSVAQDCRTQLKRGPPMEGTASR